MDFRHWLNSTGMRLCAVKVLCCWSTAWHDPAWSSKYVCTNSLLPLMAKFLEQLVFNYYVHDLICHPTFNSLKFGFHFLSFRKSVFFLPRSSSTSKLPSPIDSAQSHHLLTSQHFIPLIGSSSWNCFLPLLPRPILPQISSVPHRLLLLCFSDGRLFLTYPLNPCSASSCFCFQDANSLSR